MNRAKVLKTTKLIKIFFLILILFSTSILFAQENSENLQNTNFPPLKLIADTNYPVKAISFSNLQNQYAYAMSDTIIICNSLTDEVEKVILGHQGQIQQIKFFNYKENSFDSVNAIISYDDNNKAFIFDVDTKAQKTKLEYNPSITMKAITNFENKFVASGLDDGNIIITDLNGENQNQQLIKIAESSILNIEYSQDGNNLLITDSNRNIYLIAIDILHNFNTKHKTHMAHLLNFQHKH